MDNIVLVGSIVGIILLIVIAVKVVLWNSRRKELVRVKVQRRESDIEE